MSGRARKSRSETSPRRWPASSGTAAPSAGTPRSQTDNRAAGWTRHRPVSCFGFEASTDFDEGLAETVTWYRDQFDPGMSGPAVAWTPSCPESRTSIRSTLSAPARRVVAGATDRRFDAVEAQLGRMLARLEALDQVVTRNESELLALRQQADETLAYFRVQHDIVRDLLEEFRPTLSRAVGAPRDRTLTCPRWNRPLRGSSGTTRCASPAPYRRDRPSRSVSSLLDALIAPPSAGRPRQGLSS